MMKNTHIKGGVVAGLAISYIGIESVPLLNDVELNNTIVDMLLLSGGVVGSLLPDLDHINSYAGKKLWFISSFLNMMTRIFKYFKLEKLAKLSGHRGLMHSVVYWILTSILLLFLPEYIVNSLESVQVSALAMAIYKVFVFGIFIGTISHILLDMMTVSGVPILIPISYKKIKIPFNVRTNSNGEKVVSVVLILITIVMVFYMKFDINVIAIGLEKLEKLKI